MIEKLGFLLRFWELKARHATLGAPLEADEQLELLSLMQLVASDLRLPEPGLYESGDLPAQLIGVGTILPVHVRHVCAAALVVTAARSMPIGERVIARSSDAVAGVEYTLPCTVEWVYEESPVVMALVVDGVPTRSDLAGIESTSARAARVMSMGRSVRLVS